MSQPLRPPANVAAHPRTPASRYRRTCSWPCSATLEMLQAGGDNRICVVRAGYSPVTPQCQVPACAPRIYIFKRRLPSYLPIYLLSIGLEMQHSGHERARCLRCSPGQPRGLSRLRDLSSRLAIGVAPWRAPEKVATAVRGWIESSLASAWDEGHAVLVAVLGGHVAGMVSLAEREHFTGDPDAYVGELVIDRGDGGTRCRAGADSRRRGAGGEPRAFPDHPRNRGA